MKINHLLLKKSETVVGVVRDLRKLRRFTTQLVFRPLAIKKYIDTHPVRKLQIGSGPNGLVGWLCTDLVPESPDVIYLDATKPFPFDDETFDYVYSEHVIEHLSWQHGWFMLKESRRILRRGGSIRIATPDLEVILGLYRGVRGTEAKEYIKQVVDTQCDGIGLYLASVVINNSFRNWGHQFLYDGELLEIAMKNAGFTDIRRFRTGESSDPHLKGIEHHCAPRQIFETMVFEARAGRPAGASTAPRGGV